MSSNEHAFDKTESVVPIVERALGRLVSLDPRDRKFMARPPRAAAGVDKKFHFTGKVMDQGELPHCVAFSGVGFLAAGPVRNLQKIETPALYTDCQRNDEWEGESPAYEGTSVRALFKVLQRDGFISEYNWAFDAFTAAQWVISYGPVVLGTTWKSEMSHPKRIKVRGKYESWIRAEGWNQGGHAYLWPGVNLKKRCPFCQKDGAGRIKNSWGPEYGDNGFAWACLHCTLQPLISDWGECGMSREILRKKV